VSHVWRLHRTILAEECEEQKHPNMWNTPEPIGRFVSPSLLYNGLIIDG
jgi:hypothetical protein